MNGPRLTAIEAFVTAARTGGFSSAAEVLGLAPSSVSRAVASLEREFGVRLFSRTTRRASLTPDGRLLYERYSRLLEDLHNVRLELLEGGKQLRGKLRISIPISYGRKVLVPVLSRFLNAYPGVALDVSFSDRYVDLLEDGVDAAVRIGNFPRADYIARPIDAAGFGVFASPEYVARNGAPADPSALAGHECLAYVYPGTDRRYPWQLFEQGAEISIPPNGRLALDHGEALVDAAIEGHGIIYVQDYMVEPAIHEGRLTPILQAYWPARTSVALIYREPQHLSRRVSALIGFLRAHFEPHAEGNGGPAQA